MTIRVFIPQALRVDADNTSHMDVEASPSSTLSDVLDAVAAAHPRLDRRIRDEAGRIRRYVNVFVDSDESRALSGGATPVPDGAEVRILPSVAGG